MVNQARSNGKLLRATGNAALDVISSPEPSATTQGLTASSTKATRFNAALPNTMDSPVRDISYRQADGVQHSSGAVEGTFRDPGIPDLPGPNGRKPEAQMGLFTNLKGQMKEAEDDVFKAVLDDLQGPIRKSVEERSQRRLWTFLEQHGEAIVESLREEQAPLVRAELRRELETEIREQAPLVRAELRRELEPEVRAQLEAEFAGQREQKLAELAELDAEIERKRRSTAPSVTVQHEEDHRPSSPPVQIKREPDERSSSPPVHIKGEPEDERLDLFIEWEDQGLHNVGNNGSNHKIKQEDTGSPGTEDDVVHFPPGFVFHDELVERPVEDWNYPFIYETPADLLAEDWNITSNHEAADHAPVNPLAMEEALDDSETESDDSSGEPTIGELMREMRRCQSIPSDSDASEMEHMAKLLDIENSPIFSIRGGQTDDSSTFGNSDESTNGSQEDASNLGIPIKIDESYVADYANDEHPPNKARRSIVTRGSKRKARTAFDDPSYQSIGNALIKRARINTLGPYRSEATRDIAYAKKHGLPVSQADMFAALVDPDYIFRQAKDVTSTETLLATGDEKKVCKTQLTDSTSKTDTVQTGRAKKSMPKRMSKRNLRCGPQIKIEEEEEDEEEEL